MSGSVNKAQHAVDLYRQGLSLTDVAEAVGMAISTVRARVMEAGILRSQSEAIRLAGSKGKMSRRAKRPPMSQEARERLSQSKKRWAEENAKGISHKASGYVEFTMGDNKGRSVHVVKMEQRIGRRLLPDEHVHHIDGDKSNNDDNNLALVTRSGHMRLHRLQDNISGNHRERNEHGRFC